jgi:hypothetical protein
MAAICARSSHQLRVARWNPTRIRDHMLFEPEHSDSGWQVANLVFPSLLVMCCQGVKCGKSRKHYSITGGFFLGNPSDDSSLFDLQSPTRPQAHSNVVGEMGERGTGQWAHKGKKGGTGEVVYLFTEAGGVARKDYKVVNNTDTLQMRIVQVKLQFHHDWVRCHIWHSSKESRSPSWGKRYFQSAFSGLENPSYPHTTPKCVCARTAPTALHTRDRTSI